MDKITIRGTKRHISLPLDDNSGQPRSQNAVQCEADTQINENTPFAISMPKEKVQLHQVPPDVTAENVLNTEFYADAPNEKWLTDVTEFKCYVGAEVKKIYLSAILNLYNRRIVLYKLGDSNNNLLGCVSKGRMSRFE